jgi:hypothetical protein
VKCQGQIYQRAASCRFGEHILHRHGPGEPWVAAQLGGLGDSPECPDAPNPEDGPMPGHEPGTAAVTNPMWTGAQS